jgi:preprotein translocase subunit YajC
MELLETQDPEKKKLIETSERHKRELQKEVSAISKKTEKALKNGLIIGGSLVLTFILISQFRSSKKKRKKRKEKIVKNDLEEDDEVVETSSGMPSFLATIGENLASQATLILLDFAKDKLADYLNKRKAENENS